MVYSNQKEVLFKVIYQNIQKYNIKSVLDIGAGNGLLAKKLSKEVEKYVAVEKNKEFAKMLQEHGLTTIIGKFPLEIEDLFDMVLSSLSIPEDKSLYKPFLEGAWKLVNKGGIILICTLKGGLLENKKIHDKELFGETMQILKSFGEVNLKKIGSKIQNQNCEYLFLSVEKK